MTTIPVKRLSILGSTGSIGVQTLEVVKALGPESLQITALVAHSNAELLAKQAVEFGAKLAVCVDHDAYLKLQTLLEGSGIITADGSSGLIEAATRADIDIVVASMVGASGLEPALAAISAGKDIALANKETLVAGGELVISAVKAAGVRLLPVDSEHSAIFQCLVGQPPGALSKIILTASGGPFRTTPRELLSAVTPDDALKHPNWSMGPKITIDSATLMNKGLEVIEAHWLFGLDYDSIEVVVHPGSVVHSMIELVDGSILAQLGVADMRVPIQYALTYPERRSGIRQKLNLLDIGNLQFERPDLDKFPSLGLAYEAGKIGGLLPAAMNAANEVAVASFLQRAIAYNAIPTIVETVMNRCPTSKSNTLWDILEVDGWARRSANEVIMSIS